jgi:HNH endonuclease
MDNSFRDITGFPGYRVNREGKVESRWTRGCRGKMSDTWRPLTPIRRPWGHLVVNLHRDGNKIARYIHQLVLEAFLGPRPPGLICCHWDGNAANNRLENLRWDTYKSNCDDMLRHGTRRLGETAVKARLKESEVREIRRLMAEGAFPDDLASRYGVGAPNIKAIASGRTWRHLL